MRSTIAFGRLEQFYLEPELAVGRAVPRPYPAWPFFEERTEPAAAPTEVSFGPFRLLRKQFPLLKGDKPMPLGGRALEILPALLERRRVGQQAGFGGSRLAQCFRQARQAHGSEAHGSYVSAASALRKRFIVSIPDAATAFRRPLCRLTRIERNWQRIRKFGEALPWSRQ